MVMMEDKGAKAPTTTPSVEQEKQFIKNPKLENAEELRRNFAKEYRQDSQHSFTSVPELKPLSPLPTEFVEPPHTGPIPVPGSAKGPYDGRIPPVDPSAKTTGMGIDENSMLRPDNLPMEDTAPSYDPTVKTTGQGIDENAPLNLNKEWLDALKNGNRRADMDQGVEEMVGPDSDYDYLDGALSADPTAKTTGQGIDENGPLNLNKEWLDALKNGNRRADMDQGVEEMVGPHSDYDYLDGPSSDDPAAKTTRHEVDTLSPDDLKDLRDHLQRRRDNPSLYDGEE